MHKMETKKIAAITDMLNNALNELNAGGPEAGNDAKNAVEDINEAIEAIESWKPREFDKEEITLAYSKLENALEEIPDNASGDARSAIETAVEELKAEEKAASVGDGGNFQAQL